MKEYRRKIYPFCVTVWLFFIAQESFAAAPWQPSLDAEHYRNPIIYADYSDPDVIRVDGNYYMVSSSFNVMPGIPVLKSKDLINWRIIGHVYPKLPLEKFNKPVHGQGSWAPSIRYHNGLFYVYFCTPHDGLFVATTKDPGGTWQLKMIEAVELWEDPAPFWDDDGQAYLVRSKVRADNIYLHKMSADGLSLLGDGVLIYRDLEKQPVIEGPKMFKINGWYYIFAPAGGVKTGWQTVLRSRKPYGPYEAKTVMHQGSTSINGPHQGGLIQDDVGEWWFVHFQDQEHMGRVVHLQPVTWKNGWPIIGQDPDKDGIGEPVATWRKPEIKIATTIEARVPQTSDAFNDDKLGLQWQWHANPQPEWMKWVDGSLRLTMVKNPSQNGNLYFVPNLLLQKLPAPSFSATAKVQFHSSLNKDKAGLVMMGKQWGYIAFYREQQAIKLGVFSGQYEQYDDATELLDSVVLNDHSNQKNYFLRMTLYADAKYQFSYSLDGKLFKELGPKMTATAGVWIGAKVGLFALNPSLKESSGFFAVDWFKVK